jgi:hypothetical protein
MPIYLTGYIDEHTDRLKHFHDSILPLGMIVQPKTYREGYLRRAGLYGWLAIDNGRFTEAGRRLFRPAEYDRLIGEGLERAGDHLLFATAPTFPSTGRKRYGPPAPGSGGFAGWAARRPSAPRRG